MLLLVIAGIGMTLLLGALALGGDKSLERRLARVKSAGAPVVTAPKKDKQAERLTAVRQLQEKGRMNSLAASLLPNRDKLRTIIRQTGRNITLGQYAVWMLLSGLLGFILVHFLAGFGMPVSVIGAVGLAVWLPFKILRSMAAKRAKAFLGGFPEAIDTMVRGLKSGLPVSESINAVGREAEGPVGESFRQISDAIRLGRSLDEAMWDVAKSVALPEFRFLIISMAIQRETGGNLGETLSGLSDLLRRRRQLKLKIKAMSSEARASAMIIGSLPLVMFCLLLLVNRDYAMTLIRDPRGNIVLACGSFWMFMGVMVMKKMIDFEI